MIANLDLAEAEALLTQRADVAAPLAAMLGRMARLFHLHSPHAPASFCVGGLVGLDEDAEKVVGASSFSATGNGLSLDQAVVSCLGEAAETLSQFERPGDLVGSDQVFIPKVTSGWIGDVLSTTKKSVDWVLASDMSTNTGVAVPADICLRRRSDLRAFPVVGAMSSGTAASTNWAAAVERAILELVERDAAALWWLGGRKPFAFDDDDPASIEAHRLLIQLRSGVTSRVTLLLDLTTDLGIPVVAACSHDEAGLGLACGVAARRDRASAVRAALLEMAQMELSSTVAQMKIAQTGLASLNDADHRHLQRATLHVPSCQFFRCKPFEGPSSTRLSLDYSIPDLASHLIQNHIAVYLVDHTRAEIGIPVARAVSPQLQPFSEAVSTERLRHIIGLTGGGANDHQGIMPF